MPSLFEQKEWLSAVATLRAKAAEFENLSYQVKDTYYIAVNDPKLLKEYESLLFKGDIIKKTIQTVTSGVDIIFKGYSTMLSSVEIEQDNLGFIPLVPIAVILSAIGAITYWISDSVKYLNKINEIKRVESQGYSTKEAYKIIQGDEKGFIEKMLEPKFLLIGSGLLFVFLISRAR